MKILDSYTHRNVDPETGEVTFDVGTRWIEAEGILTEEEAIEREGQEEDAYAEDAKHMQANKAKVAALKSHHDPAVAFLAAQLLTKL